MDIKQYPLKDDQYVKRSSKKTHVVWHGTMGRTIHTPHKGKPGQATTSIDSWNTDSHGRVGATYLIDRSGQIYQCFDEKYWIYHLGLSGTDGKYDKKSVGIELANECYLLRDKKKYFAFDKINKNTEYFGKVVRKDWRDQKYWARYDEAQIDAAIELTLDVCSRNNIKPKFFWPSTTYDHPSCFRRATILCHSNCRRDKPDLLLEPWVLRKLRKAAIEIVDQ